MRQNAIRFGLAVLVTAAVLPGCDGTGPVVAERSELAQEVVNMGFRPDMIVEHKDYFLVEGDIVIPKADLQKRLDEAAAERPGNPAVRYQWSTNNLVSQSKMNWITVYIDPAVENNWAAATRQAMQYWNDVGASGVHFVEVYSNPMITVSTAEVADNPIAQASWPSAAGDPGTTITIDASYTNWGVYSQRIFVMAHELGHTIGFRHTNWQGNECGDCNGLGANQISGTPQTDAASVMNGASGGTYWSGFSNNDQIAAGVLYPAPAAPTVTSVSTNPSPARQYNPFYITINGSGFNTATAEVLLFPAGSSTPSVITSFSSKTSTQLVAGPVTLSIAGTYGVSVRNVYNGKMSQPISITVAPMY